MTNILHALRRTAFIGFAFSSFGALASGAGAQSAAVNARWQAWIGCWQQVQEIPHESMIQAVRPPAPPIVCVTPGANSSSVEIVTVDSARVLSRYSVDASGAPHAVDRDGCAGTESARWSRDSLRVFLHSDLTCANSLKRVSTGVMSIESGEWVDVHSLSVVGNEGVRAVRYRQENAPKGLPSNLVSVIGNARRLDAQTAIIAAGAPLTAAAIAEASSAIDTAAVQSWLVERHEKTTVNAKILMGLADAGVPGSVTDIMVALAHPAEYHFDNVQSDDNMAGGAALTRADSARIAADYNSHRRADCDPFSSYSPYGWGYDPCSSYGYGYNGYGYNGYNGYGSGYGYGGYGYGSYGYGGLGYAGGYPGYYYTGPVIIVSNGSGTEHGRAVKGQGYTRGGSSSAGSSTTRSPSSDAGTSGSSSGSSSSGSSGSSSGRTAHTRPPTE
ncbi:MAG: hypothetical protein ABI442_07015 [Gemmatimonadaceae bacterium]